MVPEFIPVVSSEIDVTNFDDEFTSESNNWLYEEAEISLSNNDLLLLSKY